MSRDGEAWLVYWNPVYRARPWPYGVDWETFLAAPPALRDGCEDIARVSPCDGLSETPSVPPNLPRLLPGGRYRMAIHHDADWLYVLLEHLAAAPVVSAGELRQAPQLKGVAFEGASVSVFSAGLQTLYVFGIDGAGAVRAEARPYLHGPRRRERTEPWTPRWSVREVALAGGWRRCCWRIARESLSDCAAGGALRLSVSRYAFESVEMVAWGSAPIWAPRHDEAGEVRLEARRDGPLPWPELRRVDLVLEPDGETGRLRLVWDDPYGPDERFEGPRVAGFTPRPVAWHEACVRVNGEVHAVPLAEVTGTPPLRLRGGRNLVEIATGGGPAVRFDIEWRSGVRIEVAGEAGRGGAADGFPVEAVRQRAREECEAALAEAEARRARGEAPGFRPWATYHAASCGRAYRYLWPEPRLLELLREEADCALALQRPDGTYSGYHLKHIGRPASPWAGGAYDSGPAGELWAVAAELLGDGKYLEASRRLLAAYRTYRVEFNHNYSAFALYHLAAHYRLTRDPEALAQGLYYAKSSAAAQIMPLGFQAGHNYYSCYGAITLRGLARFCAVLPEDEPWRAVLRERCLRMANQMIARQQPDGSFDARDRYYLNERRWFRGLFSAAFLLGPGDAARLDGVMARMARGALREGAAVADARLSDGDVLRYLAHREALLAGRPVDPMSLF